MRGFELRHEGKDSSAVTWGGHQNAPDGGIDVRVGLPVGTDIGGFIPRAATGFQVKAQDMSASAVLIEMRRRTHFDNPSLSLRIKERGSTLLRERSRLPR